MDPLEHARTTRLLLDRLAKDAADAEAISGHLPKPGKGKPTVIQQTPVALRTLSKKLTVGYQQARDMANGLSPEETKIRTALDEANAVIAKAQAVRDTALANCGHRVGLKDPILDPTNGAVIYPDHPTCLVCGENFKLEWYCQQSRSLRCEYPNPTPEDGAASIRGDAVETVGGEWAELVECVHCGQPWSRSR